MEPVAVVVVAVVALAAGVGVGLWLGRRRTGTAVDASARQTAMTAGAATLEAIDGVVADSIRRLATWLGPGDQPSTAALTTAEDGTLTLLFSDIEGSTTLNRRLGDQAFARLLRQHDEHVQRVVSAHGGVVVKTQGDGFLAAFHDPARAVSAALVLRDDMRDGSSLDAPLALRIGLHTGRAVTDAGDVFGENVAKAARVGSRAAGGEVLVSQEVRDRVEDVTTEVAFVGRLLPVRLKGLAGFHRLHRVAG